MSKSEIVGRVLAAEANGIYTVELENGNRVLAHVATESRIMVRRILPGDSVVLELSPYDPSRGRIVRRVS